MKKSLFMMGSVVILLMMSSCRQKNAENKWIQLFNGKDLTGWTPKITGY
ncbi:MAG TPA: DUF1080 domain-containing protein, partial [Porphyromonadaceae bacterium]|nr:DUF1080 domain-containing protein [Porphyromonadaceae bacterium]